MNSDAQLQALKVAARFSAGDKVAIVMPPRRILPYIGKFEQAFKHAVAKVMSAFEVVRASADQYRDFLDEIGLRVSDVFRKVKDELRDVEWALDRFQSAVKQRKLTKVRDTDTLPQLVTEDIRKVLHPESKLNQLLSFSDPHKVKQVLADHEDYQWNEKYEEGVHPNFLAAIADLHSAASTVDSLLKNTQNALVTFMTGDVKPDRVETLYHASVKARQIYQNGFSAEMPKDEVGLGGSQAMKSGRDGISFTYDLKAALDIARSFKEAAMIAVGEIKASTILNWGVHETDLDEFVIHLKSRLEKSGFKQRVKIDRNNGRWVVREDNEEGQLEEKGIDQIFKTPEAVFEVYDAYIWAHPTRMNPVHMNRRRLMRYLKTADPKDIGVVSATVNMTDPDVTGYGGEREFRVPPSAVIEVTRLYQ